MNPCQAWAASSPSLIQISHPPKKIILSTPVNGLQLAPISENNIHYFFITNLVNTQVILFPSVSPMPWVLRCEGRVTLSILECRNVLCQIFIPKLVSPSSSKANDPHRHLRHFLWAFLICWTPSEIPDTCNFKSYIESCKEIQSPMWQINVHMESLL